eukprot:3643648-Heterocapsa_arctica.AAC.1
MAGQSDAKQNNKNTTAHPPAAPQGPPAPELVFLLIRWTVLANKLRNHNICFVRNLMVIASGLSEGPVPPKTPNNYVDRKLTKFIYNERHHE